MSSASPSFIEKAARFLYRERHTVDPEAQLRHDRRLIFGFTGMLLAALGLFAFYFYQDAAHWYRMRPEVVVEKESWQVLLDPAQFSEKDLTGSERPWADAPALTDPRPAAKLRAGDAAQVWMRVRIPAEQVRKAAEVHAYYFRLGFLIGDIRMWVGGRQLVSIPNTYTGNIDLALPIHQLEAGGPLTVVINMTPREGATNIVPLTLGIKSGLVAYGTGAAFMRFNHFINRSRPLALFFVYSVFSLIFFVLWCSNRVQREYLSLSAYALVISIPPLMFSDSFTTAKLRDAPAHITYLILVMLQAAAGLSLGLTFARSHSKIISRILWGLVLAGAAAVMVLPQEMRSALRQPLNQFLMPGVFLLGALACHIQARFMSSPASGLSQPARVGRLNLFSGLLLGMAALYFVQFHAKFDYVTKQLLFDFPALLLVMFMGYLALLDYRQQSRLVRRIPLSIYHRRPELPERLEGAVVMVDLKNSENYFAYARQTAGFESVMPTVLSHIWTAINQGGGTVLKAEGDEVVAFFEAGGAENPLQGALESMDRIALQLKIYSDELRSQYEGLEKYDLHFRGAVALGEIRPTWVEGASGRLPAWVQVGESMVFVEAARLLEIEKQVEAPVSADASGPGAASRVLISSSAREKLMPDEARLRGEFLFRRRKFIGKHQNFYTVDVYEATAAPAVWRSKRFLRPPVRPRPAGRQFSQL